MKAKTLIICTVILVIQGCGGKSGSGADEHGFTAPTKYTAEINDSFYKKLPFKNKQDFEDAKRGFIGTTDELKLTDKEGNVIWDLKRYGFIKGKAPESVNPSLWRQAKLNSIHGLFKVKEGIYQVRGLCLSNMTFIRGKRGWIIVDPLTTKETAEAAMRLFRKHLGNDPVTAILFTHSHIDHFGGVQGIMTLDEARKNQVPIIAPEGFLNEAVSENILAGIAMARRSAFQFGKDLAASARAHVDTGLGKTVPYGTYGLVPPTQTIGKTPEAMVIDGVKFIFQYTPESEAPAEFTFYLPEHRAFCGAEIVSMNLHNIITLRGAKVRDALKWSGYIDEAIELFGTAEIYFASHHWPIWGNKDIISFLEKQRDLYKYIHDQTLRLTNEGLTPREIAEELELPKSLGSEFYNRDYYGTLSHNSKAVYQHYFGWYNGNPANLNPLPPTESAKKYVKYMGGGGRVLKNARESYKNGDYRWTAEVLNHLVFADPGNNKAKDLLAKTYDQLGYQAESGVWRNVYLKAAHELRHGAPKTGINPETMYEIMKYAPPEKFFQSMAVRLNGPKAEGKTMAFNITFSDLGENYVLKLDNSVLRNYKTGNAAGANASLTMPYSLFVKMLLGKAEIKDVLFSGKVKVTGSRTDLIRFLMLMDKPKGIFNIVTP